jgi:hypothetical protein
LAPRIFYLVLKMKMKTRLELDTETRNFTTQHLKYKKKDLQM